MRQNLFSIAPDAPFLPTLAGRILDGTLLSGWPRSGPFWLADVTIFLPTRRARFALAEAFIQKLGGAALLPDIRTFGGELGEEGEPFLPPLDAPLAPPAVSSLERRLVLAQFVEAWARTADGAAGFASPPNAAEILVLADSLGRFIDDLAIEGVDPGALRSLVPEELAAAWQQTLRFLDIALSAWPQTLAERGKADAAPLRNERLARQALAAPLIYGERPVIAAGSTGSVPATANLLLALSRLPRGAVVLPGLDTSLSSGEHAKLIDPAQSPYGHPQYGLAKLLVRLRAAPGMVEELATSPRPARTLVVRRALSLPDETAHWVTARAALADRMAAAGAGLAVLCAPTPDQEARAIALAARQGLADGQSVGIVSPDQNLARRIASELQRFGVRIDDAAGTPLFQSAAGRLLREILVLAENQCAPIDLMALLRNRATRLGLARADVSRLGDAIELALLRGQRPRPGIAGLRLAVAGNLAGTSKHPQLRLMGGEGEEIEILLDRLEAALAPVVALLARPVLRAAELAETLAGALAAIAGPLDADLPGSSELAGWATDLAARPGDGPTFPPQGLDGVLYALMAGIDVRRPGAASRDDIVIWGQLEARLQSPDLLILAGLNEDIWPRPADPGPWLSRGMRLAIGLEPPERDQGRAAHDFEMALGNGQVILAFAERLGTSPALPSRLVQRLEAFFGTDIAKALRARGDVWVKAARAVDAVAKVEPALRPAPTPPASARPRKLSVTEVETLFRSPYDLYARHVLRLRAMDPLGEAPGGRERGSMIHEVFAAFVIENHDFAAPDAPARLGTMAREAFAGLDAIGERRDIWLRRFSLAARRFLDFERTRGPRVGRRHAEIEGEWLFPDLDNFRLTGRADRVDEMHGGTLEIIDFKTGSLPSSRDMKNFEAPQLLLEAAMARAGALQKIPPGDIGALDYIKIGLGPQAFLLTPFKLREDHDLASAATEIVSRLRRHVAEFLLSDRYPMTARIRPDPGRRYRGEYDHLARTDEWMQLEDEL